MRIILLLFVTAAISTGAFAQTGVKWQKTAIGNSGAYVYMPGPCEPAVMEKSPDSSLVYTMNSVVDNYVFDVVFVKMSERVGPDEMEPLLISYMDFLKGTFEVTSAAGYGKGHTLGTHDTAKGVLDYWTDKDGNSITIMGWIDAQYIAVLAITGTKSADYNVSDVFRKGIRFPGD